MSQPPRSVIHEPIASQAEIELLLLQAERNIGRESKLFGWVRSRSTLLRQVVGVSLTLMVPLGYALAKPRVDLGLYPHSTMIAVALLLSLLLAVLTSTKLASLGKPGVLRDNLTMLIVLCGIAVALPPLLAPTHDLLPASAAGVNADFWPRVGACFVVGSLLGLVVLALVFALDRAPRWSVSLSAAVVGLVGTLALQIHCPSTDSEHLWLGHAAILYVALALAVLVSVIRSRAARRGKAPRPLVNSDVP